jgi:endonuclease/exonuclease/phosphatase (EEP) superfamily protein YafD
MHLFSRLRLVDPEVRFLIDEYVPSIRAGLETRSGAVVALHSVHPAPPPLQDAARRDAELLLVALVVREGGGARPAIVMGDLNDVAWSATTRLFQKVGGLLDLRVGRGVFPTFHADRPLLRWPLDHVFFDRSFGLMGAEVMPDVGSDHFPFLAALCHRPGAAWAHDVPEADPEDLRAAAEAVRDGREKAARRR